MPRLVRSVPRYRKHRATGQALVTISGRDFYLGLYGSKASRVEYDRLIGEWLAGGRRPAVVVEELTIGELMIRYLEHAKSHYRKNGELTTEYDGIRMAFRYLKAAYSHSLVSEFGPLSLKAIRLKMVEADLARSTINRNISRIQQCFRWAASEQLIDVATSHALDTVNGLQKGRSDARETDPVLPVSDEAVDATLPHLPAVVADMVRLQRLTGMRPAEVCSLRPADINRDEDVWQYRPAGHKTEHHGKGRVVFIGARGQQILLRYLVRAADAYCFSPADSEAKRLAERHANRTARLCCGNRPGTNRVAKPKRTPGDRYEVDAYRRAITRACELAFPAPEGRTTGRRIS